VDPRKFLEFAENLCTQTLCDEETDTRVGIDRCYYAAAHKTFQSIYHFVDTEDSPEAAKDINLMAPQIHAMLRRVLQIIGATIENRIGWLFQKRKVATYYLNTPPVILKDAVEAAQDAFDNQEILIEELRRAYDSETIDSTYWFELKQKLHGK
jgi:hypothetical protein